MTQPIKNCVFCIASQELASEILQQTEYKHPSVKEEGFMHLCLPHQVNEVVNTFYPGATDLKLLVIDVSLLDAKLIYEGAAGDFSDDDLVRTFFSTESFPHLYGALNVDAIVDVVDVSRFNQKPIHPDTVAMLRHYRFERLPVEGTLFKSTWRATQENENGEPAGTAMIGLYANEPESVSCFHKLDFDEVWHAYNGDPFTLYLLYPDGKTKEILMGTNPIAGEHVQYVIPAGVWQAGCLNDGGRYALFGCTMAPGFTGTCFEAGLADELIKQYPSKTAIIKKLSVNGHQTNMPEGFAT
jgi:predicted cupin superfamily sugar epimerase